MPAPFEMVSGPLTVYTAPEGTLAPEISAVTPPSIWTLLGTNGARSISDDGLTATFEESIESQRSLGSTGVQKLFRTEEDVMFGLALLDVTVETFGIAMSGLTVTQVPVSTQPADFTAPPPIPTVSSDMAGIGAVVASITVDASGDITDVTWTSGGTGYVAGEVLTFTQGDVTGTYALQAGDLTSGVIDPLATVAIAGTTRTEGYRHAPMLRGFNVENLSFLMRGFSPYGDNMNAQFWVPKAYAMFSGEIAYTKGEAAMIEIEIMAIEHLTYGYGQYQGQDTVAP